MTVTRWCARVVARGALALSAVSGGSALVCTMAAPATASTPGRAVVSHTSTGDMFARRYCELLMVDTASRPIAVKVWNSYPLNRCPAAAWAAVDTVAVAQQNQVPVVVRNGPRFWTIDSVTKVSSAPLVEADQGGLDMYLDATVQLADLSRVPYSEHQVDRTTVFRYRAGRRVYELLAPGAKTYVMQSWSQQVDPTVTLARLAQLGQRLHLPAGWRYRSLVLRRPLVVDTVARPAVVLQDDLQDSYSLIG